MTLSFMQENMDRIKRILGECLLISSLPGNAFRMLTESCGLHAFSKPNLENLIPGILFIS